MNKPELEDTISEAVNLLHQYRDELVSFHEGTKQRFSNKQLRNSRAMGITLQCDSITKRLLTAYHGPAREEDEQ